MLQMADVTRLTAERLGEQAARDARREERTDEARMKIEVKPPRINARSPALIWDEIEEFELRLCQYGIRSWKQHLQFFENALNDEIVTWLRGQQERGPHAEEWRLCMTNEATDHQWSQCYAFVRSELIRYTMAGYSRPEEAVKKSWRQFEFTSSDTRNHIRESMNLMSKLSRRMYKVGVWTSEPDDVREQISRVGRISAGSWPAVSMFR